MKRRLKLTPDVLALLERQPNMTQAQIAAGLKAKPNSVRAVLWKLVNCQKILATKNAKAAKMTGPKVVNVYCLAEGIA